jgi:branched-chain amino acid transport system substrate-binding protein
VAAVAAAMILAATGGACSGSSLDGPQTHSGPIRIGLMIPQSGPYQVSAPEIRDGFQLYLDLHGGQLGGKPVKVIIADEGDGKSTAANAGKKLIQQDQVDVVVGTTTVDSLLSIQAQLAEAKIPFVGTGGRPSTLRDVSHIWHTSWLSREPGQAIADYIRSHVDGPVYAIGPDYQGGADQVGGFTDAFTAGGGRLANPGGKTTWTPWPATTNFLPFLNQIAGSGAKAVYTFYAGAPAVAFVQQYAQSGLKDKVTLYASGFLTDDSILGAEGTAADGIQTVLNYASDLDNAANRAFVVAFGSAHAGATPHLIHVTSWDAAALLDQAIALAGRTPTPEAINTAIGQVKQIDSPRGTWRWSTDHTPVQSWYLRQVRTDGRTRANVLIQPLTTLGKTS